MSFPERSDGNLRLYLHVESVSIHLTKQSKIPTGCCRSPGDDIFVLPQPQGLQDGLLRKPQDDVIVERQLLQLGQDVGFHELNAFFFAEFSSFFLFIFAGEFLDPTDFEGNIISRDQNIHLICLGHPHSLLA